MQLLLEAGADPNDILEDCGTVLQFAAFCGDELVVTHLLDAGVDVNIHCEGNCDSVGCPWK